MHRKIILFTLILLIVSIGIFTFINYKNSKVDSFVYITDDYMGSWYFDKNSIEERADIIEGINAIDVWMKRDVNKIKNKNGSDVLLWHIDPVKIRYKVSDAFAYDDDGKLLDA